jgi:rsbT co-antagonist protein RsbR
MSIPPRSLIEVRIQRLIDAISLIGVGELDAALERLPEPAAADDELDLLEACTRVLIGEVAASRDASARYARELEASRKALADRLELIQRQSVALADLSTPIIEVWEHTLALPIIGAIDEARAATMAETLLHSVAERRARHVLVDLTGVEDIDAETFRHLTRLARAVELLGARCVFTGLGPNVARTLVGMNLELGALRTHPTLKEGLRAVVGGARLEPRP